MFARPDSQMGQGCCTCTSGPCTGTSSIDRTWKLVEYFRLPSVHHYLIIWPDKQQVVHHRRDDARGVIDTQVFTSGHISLDPPGLTITVEDIY